MPKTNFIDGDPSQGIKGTTVLSGFLNKIFSTGGGHKHDGGTEDGSCNKINMKTEANVTDETTALKYHISAHNGIICLEEE